MASKKKTAPKSTKQQKKRKTKPTLLEKYPKRVANLLKAIESGLPYETACKLSNIISANFYNWKKWGEEARKRGEENIYSKFLEKCEKAEAKAEARALVEIQKAGSRGNWQAWAWFLERRYPDRYGKQVKTIGDDKLDIEFDFEIIEEDKNEK